MQQLLIILHILICLGIVGLVLLQHGKGADVGATFGGGSSNTMFGSAGTMPFLVKVTACLAAAFFASSLLLGLMAREQVKKQDTIFNMTPSTQQPMDTTSGTKKTK